VKLQ
jgi:hypothetical protein